MKKALTRQHPSDNDCFVGDAVEDTEETDMPLSSLSIGGRPPLCNLRFADDIDQLGGSDEELQQLTEILENAAAGYGMEITSGERKIIVSSIKPRPSTNIWTLLYVRESWTLAADLERRANPGL